MDSRVEELIAAARSGDIGTLLSLLRAGVDADGVGATGETALLVAAGQAGDRTGTVNNLLGKGANPNAVDPVRGRTALHLACEHGRVEMVQRLLEAGADPEPRDKSGLTPGDLGVRTGHSGAAKAIEAFMERRADRALTYLSSDVKQDVVMAAAIRGDGKLAAAAVRGATHRIVLWDIENETILAAWEASTNGALCFTPDGSYLLSGGADNDVQLWSLPEGKLVRKLERLGSLGRTSVSLSQDGATALCMKNWSILWDIADGHTIHAFPKPRNVPHASSLSPDGSMMLEGSTLWDCRKFEKIGDLPGTPAVASFLASDSLVTVSEPDKSSGERGADLKKWQLPDCTVVQTMKGHAACVDALCASGDGRLILSAGRNGEIRLWNAKTGQCVARHGAGKGVCDTMGLSTDGKIAAFGYRTSLVIWHPLATPDGSTP